MCFPVSHQHVLTTASCVDYRDFPKQIGVLVGTHVVSGTIDPDAKLYHVEKGFIHPAYKDNSEINIAVVQIDRTMTFSTKIVPVCLPFG